MFVQSEILLLLSFVIAGLLIGFKKEKIPAMNSVLHAVGAYILSFFLLKYGLDKCFQSQFYFPEPNTLHTSVGHLTKDILFWSSMGSSSTYNYFMGIIEVIPGLLLLHSRSRALGAFISIGVMANVFATNIGFDISVKLLSAFLLVLSAYVFTPSAPKIINAFLNTKINQHPLPSLRLRTLPKRIVKGSLLALLAIEILLPYLQFGNTNGRDGKSIAFHGSYDIEVIDGESALIPETTKRIHIHNRGYLITESVDGKFQDHPITISNQTILTQNRAIRIDSTTHQFVLNWIEPNDTVRVKLRPINMKALPLADDSFHLTVESMLRDMEE